MKRSIALLHAVLLTATGLSAQVENQYTGISDLEALTGLNSSTNHWRHNRVASAGDVNGDGVQDFLVGLPGAYSGVGKVVVYSGRRLFQEPYFDEITSSVGARVYGSTEGDAIGIGACGLGDINEDGYDDYAISSGKGRYVMICLGPSGTLLQTLAPSGTEASDLYGSSLVSADLDGDGTKELIVGDPNWRQNGSSSKGMIEVYRFTRMTSYVSWEGGSSNKLVNITRLIERDDYNLYASPDVRVNLVARHAGQDENWFGADLARLAMGSQDYLVVGAPRMEDSPGDPVPGGQAFLLREDPSTAYFDLEVYLTIEDSYSSTEAGKFGFAVASVGDISGADGVEEFAIGAPEADAGMQDNGYVVVYDLAGNVLLARNGTAVSEGFGAALDGIGDIDGDLIPDFAVGAPGVLGGPGHVALLSGADGSTLDDIAGTNVDAQFGWELASTGDVDGDGSRDIVLMTWSGLENTSSVTVLRPLHSLPYRVTVDATGTGTSWAPIHGVNHGPGHQQAWTKQIGTDDPYLANRTSDYSDFYAANGIPNTRIHGEGVGDLNYMWLLDQGLVDDMSRDYAVPQEELTNILNYDFRQFDTRMAVQDQLPGMETIWRIGHDKAEIPGSEEWYAGFTTPPNDMDGMAQVTAQILKRYNEGWGGGAPLQTPLRLVELWNEPHLKFWTGTGTEYGQMHVAVLAALDAAFDDDGDGKADDLTMITTLPPGNPDGWTTDVLDVLEEAWTPEAPHKGRVDATVMHWYTVHPYQFLKKFESLDTFFTTLPNTYSVLNQGVDLEVTYPEVYITEWNRTIDQYARTYASMPFIMNSFYYLNGLYHKDFLRTDGQPFTLDLKGANYYSAKDLLWKHLIDPVTHIHYYKKDHAGLAWEVYGQMLYGDASERLEVSGPFNQPALPQGQELSQIRDFTVLAGRSPTSDRVVLVVSSMLLTDSLDHPNTRDTSKRLPYVLDVPDLGFIPTSIRRYVQETDQISFKSGQEAALVEVATGGSFEVPYSAWLLQTEGPNVNIQVSDMISNSYEVIIIDG